MFLVGRNPGCALIYRKTMPSSGNVVQIVLGNEVVWNEGATANGGVRFAGKDG